MIYFIIFNETLSYYRKWCKTISLSLNNNEILCCPLLAL